jgi:hypothetical protein
VKHARSWTTIAVAFAASLSTVGDAADVVEIRLRGHFFAEPATVRITVAVEPAEEHRMLRIAADGEQYYRASELTLDGDRDKRLHTVELKNLPAGEYMLSAEVMSADALLARATQELVVTRTAGR